MRRYNPRRVKIHRTYAVDEAAKLFGSHRNTVRNWLGRGLEPIDARRPILIQGTKLRDFLLACRSRNRCRCGPGQFYCVRCRAPKHPAARRADYLPITSASGNLKGTCPDCAAKIYRRVSLKKLASAAGDLDVTLPEAQQRIEESAGPSENCDLEHEDDSDADTQSRQ